MKFCERAVKINLPCINGKMLLSKCSQKGWAIQLASRKTPEIIGADNIPLIMEKARVDIHTGVIQPLESALRQLQLLKERVSNFQLLALTGEFAPAIIIREKTMHSIFESFRKKIAEDIYQAALYEAGYDSGETLSEDLFKYLKNIDCVLQDNDALLTLWTELLDSGAGWGKYSGTLNMNELKLTITIKDSFLTKVPNENRHLNCPFLRGYIFAFVWEAFKERYRQVSDVIKDKLKYPPLEPVSVEEITSDSLCIFDVQLKYEELCTAFQELYEAKKSYDAQKSLPNGNFAESVRLIRNALDHAFKEKFGMRTSDQRSVRKIIEALKNTEIKLPYDQALGVWDRTSDIIHNDIYKEHKECFVFYQTTKAIVNQLERLDLSKFDKDQFKKRI